VGKHQVTNRLIQRTVVGNPARLVLEFETGHRYEKVLPEISDLDSIRQVRDIAVNWAASISPITVGQENSIKKALTDSGYFVRLSSSRRKTRRARAYFEQLSAEDQKEFLKTLEGM